MKKILYIFLSLAIVFSTTISAYAGLPQSVTDYAVSIKNVAKNGVGVVADFAFKKRAANEPEWAAPAKSVSNMKIASGFFSRFLKFGAGAVGFLIIQKLLDGTDWIINEGSREITRTVPNVNNYAFCTSSTYDKSTCFGDPAALIRHLYPNRVSEDGKQRWEKYTAGALRDNKPVQDVANLLKPSAPVVIEYTYDYHKMLTNGSWDVTTYPNTRGAFVVHAPDTYTTEYMTAPQLSTYLNDAPVSDLAALLQPQPNVDPAQDPAYEDLYADPAAAAEPTDDTTPDPDPDPDPQPEPDPDSEPNDKECPTGYIESPNGTCVAKPQSSELPDFCSWATPVCDFAYWFKQEWAEFTLTLTALKDWFFEEPPSEQDDSTIDTTPVPIVPAQVAIDFVGSCPAPLTFEYKIYNQTFTVAVPFDPMCEVAILINPVIKICATIGAIYIVAGIRQGST